jgi:hypothetical protein
MLGDTESKPTEPGCPNIVLPRNRVPGRTCWESPHAAHPWIGRILYATGWKKRLAVSFLAAVSISIGSSSAVTNRTVLPVEILGADGTTASRTVVLEAGQAESARSLWMQVNGLRYSDQASVQVNSSVWLPLNNETVKIAEPGKRFGGIGGFATLGLTLPLPKGIIVDGHNTIRFRFNRTDGFASGYRVLAWNFLTVDQRKILPADEFAEDKPESWAPPLPDAASIEAGRELWRSASLKASSLTNSSRIQAHCGDCHAHDGRDLKYFNFSNESIVTRSRFHGLSTLEGAQIASYIRSLPVPNPGRPWNPPYQPGPALDEQPISTWAAGAGLAWVLEHDTDAFPYLLGQYSTRTSPATPRLSENASSLAELAGKITPELFRPDGNLNARQIPVAFELPDWSQWLPRIHPKDAWGRSFTRSSFAALYGGEEPAKGEREIGKKSLRTLLTTARNTNSNPHLALAAFAHWSQARRALFRRVSKAEGVWSPALTNNVYSTQQWQLVKTWEMMQEFGLEGRGHELFGSTADSRTWFNTVPAETAPLESHIPDGPVGVGGSALTNEYFTAAWYELQIVLNSGNHQHRDRSPVDWVYLIGGFQDLYVQTQQPEPARLLVAVIKALQSTDPRLGPDDLRQGWRPDQNIDPRIMISPVWDPIFKPLPIDLRRDLTTSLLTAWLDKNLQYPTAEYLPVGTPPRSYSPSRTYGDISGGKAWESAKQFRDAGVSLEVVERLRQWGIAYTDRAARIRYE